MISVAVAGYSGRMGATVVEAVTAADDMHVVCGIDPYQSEADFPTFTSIDDALEHCEHPYHVFHGIYEARRVFVLLVTTRIGYVIAKSDLSEGETEQLRALFKEKFEQPLVYFDV